MKKNCRRRRRMSNWPRRQSRPKGSWNRRAAKDKPSLVIYPEYVWIEPGRKEYVLTVQMDKTTPKPVLGGHQFEGGGLVLHELREQIADNGQIRLTMERPADMTGYGEGTLVLDLAGQKKTICLYHNDEEATGLIGLHKKGNYGRTP